MARHQRMPSKEAGYTYAVEPSAIDRLLANPYTDLQISPFKDRSVPEAEVNLDNLNVG